MFTTVLSLRDFYLSFKTLESQEISYEIQKKHYGFVKILPEHLLGEFD